MASNYSINHLEEQTVFATRWRVIILRYYWQSCPRVGLNTSWNLTVQR